MTAKSPSGKGIHQDLDTWLWIWPQLPTPPLLTKTVPAEDLEALFFSVGARPALLSMQSTWHVGTQP